MREIWNYVRNIIEKNRIKSLISVILFILLGEIIYKQDNSIIHNLTYNPAFDGILFLSFFILIAYIKYEKYIENNASSNYGFKDFCKKEGITIVQRWFLEELIEDFNKNEDKLLNNNNNASAIKDRSIEENEEDCIKTQIENAKLNTYNNSYLTFCLLIDRCIEIADNKEQPYCFQEIAEAFKLDWKGRRYLHYIANSLLGTIGGLLEKENENKQGNEKIPCVNASVVTKWERDHGNKWFCNGGIKTPAWCCYPPYTSKEGEDDRKFIVELCKIVKNADENKIKSWKNKYYELLKEEFETKNEKIKQDENKFKFIKQEALNELYKNYKENGTKMSYQEIEKQAQENNSKSNRYNDKENKEKDDNDK